MGHTTFQLPWPFKCYIHGKCSYKVLLPPGPNLWPQFRLREICGEQGLLARGLCAPHTITWHEALPLFLPSINRDAPSAPSNQSSPVPLQLGLSIFQGRKRVAVAVFMCSERKCGLVNFAFSNQFNYFDYIFITFQGK